MIRPPYLSVDLYLLSNAFDHYVTRHSVTKRSRSSLQGDLSGERRVSRFSFFDIHLSSVMDGYDFPIGHCRNGVCPICRSGLNRDNTLSVDLHLSSYGFDHSVTKQRIPHAPSRGRDSYKFSFQITPDKRSTYKRHVEYICKL